MTLVELIVTILILAVLAALSAPALLKVQKTSRTAACQANLRKIGVGLANFAADRGRTVGAYRNSMTWGQQLADMDSGLAAMSPTNFNPAFRCPENRVQIRSVGSGAGEKQTSYAINGFSTSEGMVEFRYTDQPPGAFAAPSKLYAVTEGAYYRSSEQNESGKQVVPENLYPGKGLDNARYPHDGGMNILFADGHVERCEGPVEGRGAFVKAASTQSETYANGIHWYAK